MPVAIPEDVQAMLKAKNFWHLATVGPRGAPQSTPIWADTDGTHVIVNSALGRAKVRNMRADGRVALSSFDFSNPYGFVEIQGQRRRDHRGPAGRGRHRRPVREVSRRATLPVPQAGRAAHHLQGRTELDRYLGARRLAPSLGWYSAAGGGCSPPAATACQEAVDALGSLWRPATNQTPCTGSVPMLRSRCGTVESNEIESPGPRV